jgi:hypothetical protein
MSICVFQRFRNSAPDPIIMGIFGCPAVRYFCQRQFALKRSKFELRAKRIQIYASCCVARRGNNAHSSSGIIQFNWERSPLASIKLRSDHVDMDSRYCIAVVSCFQEMQGFRKEELFCLNRSDVKLYKDVEQYSHFLPSGVAEHVAPFVGFIRTAKG